MCPTASQVFISIKILKWVMNSFGEKKLPQNWFQVPFCLEYFFSKSETVYISCTFSLKKIILKEQIILTKLKKQNVVWANEFSRFTMKVVCATSIVLGFFSSTAKWIFPVHHESCMCHIHRSWVFRLYCKMTAMNIRLYCIDPAICDTFQHCCVCHSN